MFFGNIGWSYIIFVCAYTTLSASTPGEELVYTFPLESDKQTIPAPVAVCDGINLIIRTDIEVHAAMQENSIGVAVVGQKQGVLPINFGPFYMRQGSSFSPKWLFQENLTIDKPLEPLTAPKKFLLPTDQCIISLDTQNRVVKQAEVDREYAEKLFALKQHLWNGVVFLTTTALVCLIVAPLYLFYRSRYPVRAIPTTPHWTEELEKITKMPVEQAAVQLHKLLCTYLAWQFGESAQGKTVAEFIPILEKAKSDNLQIWQGLSDVLEKVLYDKQPALFTEALVSSRQVIRDHH